MVIRNLVMKAGAMENTKIELFLTIIKSMPTLKVNKDYDIVKTRISQIFKDTASINNKELIRLTSINFLLSQYYSTFDSVITPVEDSILSISIRDDILNGVAMRFIDLNESSVLDNICDGKSEKTTLITLYFHYLSNGKFPIYTESNEQCISMIANVLNLNTADDSYYGKFSIVSSKCGISYEDLNSFLLLTSKMLIKIYHSNPVVRNQIDREIGLDGFSIKCKELLLPDREHCKNDTQYYRNIRTNARQELIGIYPISEETAYTLSKWYKFYYQSTDLVKIEYKDESSTGYVDLHYNCDEDIYIDNNFDGNPSNVIFGAHKCKIQRNNNGMPISKVYLNDKNEIVTNENGVSVFKYSRLEEFPVIEETYYNSNDFQVYSNDMEYSSYEYRIDFTINKHKMLHINAIDGKKWFTFNHYDIYGNIVHTRQILKENEPDTYVGYKYDETGMMISKAILDKDLRVISETLY